MVYCITMSRPTIRSERTISEPAKKKPDRIKAPNRHLAAVFAMLVALVTPGERSGASPETTIADTVPELYDDDAEQIIARLHELPRPDRDRIEQALEELTAAIRQQRLLEDSLETHRAQMLEHITQQLQIYIQHKINDIRDSTNLSDERKTELMAFYGNVQVQSIANGKMIQVIADGQPMVHVTIHSFGQLAAESRQSNADIDWLEYIRLFRTSGMHITEQTPMVRMDLLGMSAHDGTTLEIGTLGDGLTPDRVAGKIFKALIDEAADY